MVNRQKQIAFFFNDSSLKYDPLINILKKNGYIVRLISAEQLPLVHNKSLLTDIILLEEDMSVDCSYKHLQQLKSDPTLSFTPIIVVSKKNDTQAIVTALNNGAIDYITPPFTLDETLARIEVHLEKSAQHKLLERQILNQNTELKNITQAYKLLEKQINTRTRELTKSDERFELAMRGANDGLWDWDVKTGEVFYSARWMSMLGYDSGELLSTLDTWIKLTHPDDISKTLKLVDACAKGVQDSYSLEFRMLHKDGHWVHILSRAFAVREKSNNEVLRFVGTHVDLTERKKLESELLYQANHDNLTGLPNRKLAIELLTKAIATARRNRSKIAVLFMDLDGFKIINDTLGHDVGDLVLMETAKRLRDNLREVDTVARIGGDEFLVILEGVIEKSCVSLVAEKLVDSLRQPYKNKTNISVIGVSIGISLYPDNGEQLDELINRADQSMYEIKSRGKNNYTFTDNL